MFDSFEGVLWRLLSGSVKMATYTEEAVFHRKVQNRLADRYLEALELGIQDGDNVQ